MIADALQSLVNPQLRKVAERFLKKVTVCEDSGCWLWQGCTQDSNRWHRRRFKPSTLSPNLRGRFRLGDRVEYAHRVAWLLFRGELDAELVVMHSECDNSICVNPWHLGLGTFSENTRDMVCKGRHYAAILQGRDSTLFAPVPF